MLRLIVLCKCQVLSLTWNTISSSKYEIKIRSVRYNIPYALCKILECTPVTECMIALFYFSLFSIGAYGGVAQNTSAPNYTFSYPNPIYYQPPYPYHLAVSIYLE